MTEIETFASLHLDGKPIPLRFGVMCNGMVFQRWQADALNELNEHGHHLVLMIRDSRRPPGTSRLRNLLKKKWNTLPYTFLENRMFKPVAKMPVNLQKQLQNVETLSCLVEKKGYSEYFNDPDIGAIREFRLDFILRFGFGIIRGEILSAARFGVWSFHHDDEMLYRGGPPGFWEIYRNDPVNGAMLQRLTPNLDGGVVLKKGYLKTIMHSYRENLNQLLMVSSSWPAQVADDISHKLSDLGCVTDTLATPGSNTAAPVFKLPGNGSMLKFLFLLIRNRIKFYYRELWSAEIWNVGVIMKPVHEIVLANQRIRDKEVTWLPPVARPGYLADPFGFIENNRLHILAEDYSYREQKAIISEMVLPHPDGVGDPDGVVEPVRAIYDAPHLSYPYTFDFLGDVYCLPESYRSDKLTLYLRDRVTGLFTRKKIILEGVRAVDPILLFYDNMWWLFFSERKYSNTHLFLYYSPGLRDDFIPHRMNPVKIDIRSARPAGTPFIYENILYRPAQDCSATYGARVAINRIVHLSPEEFAEETLKYIEPVQGSRYGRGLHTISAVGNITLIDGKRYQFNCHYLLHQLRKKMSRKDPEHV